MVALEKRAGRVLFACVGALATALPVAAVAAAPRSRELVLLNRAPRTIAQIYVSPHSAERWGDNRLGGNAFEPGTAYHLRLGREAACVFDIQVVYDDASQEEADGVNICRTHRIRFDGARAVAATPPSGATHRIAFGIVNASGRPIQQLFISPVEATQWGDDLFGNHSLSVGERMTVNYRGPCIGDLRVVFDNRSAEERRGLDLCAMAGVLIQPGWDTADEAPAAPRATSAQSGAPINPEQPNTDTQTEPPATPAR